MKILICCAIAAWAICTNVCYAADTFVGEAYVVMDQKALNLYINEIPWTGSYATRRAEAIIQAQQDIQYIFSETNKILSSLAAFGVNFQVKLSAVTILDTNVFPGYAVVNGNLIQDGSALNLYSLWLSQQQAHARNNYDFAILLTGFDISGSSGISETSVVYPKKICDPADGLIVAEYNGTYSTVVAITQNIGLLLGALPGSVGSDNVMAPSTGPKDKNRWSFDQRNALDIQQFLLSLKPNCLQVTYITSTTPSLSYATYSGRILDSNAVCERTLNDSRSYTCLSTSLYDNQTAKGDTICQQLYCQWPDTTYCITAFPSDGMICDNRKRCNKGKCLPDTSAASAITDSECVLGDQKRLVFPSFPFDGTCTQFLAQEGTGMCYNSVVQNLCCASCKRYRTNILGCEYGDRNAICSLLDKSTACSLDNAAICCSTCQNVVGKRSTSQDRSFYKIKDSTQRHAHAFDGFKAKFQDKKLRNE